MNASEQIRHALARNRDVTAISSTIRPSVLSYDDALPAIVYQVIHTDPATSLQGDTGNLDRVRVQIDCYAHAYGEAYALAAAVRSALQKPVPLKVAPQTSDDLAHASFIGSHADYNDTTDTHRWVLEFYIWQRPEH